MGVQVFDGYYDANDQQLNERELIRFLPNDLGFATLCAMRKRRKYCGMVYVCVCVCVCARPYVVALKNTGLQQQR